MGIKDNPSVQRLSKLHIAQRSLAITASPVDGCIRIGQSDIQKVLTLAKGNSVGRARICVHQDPVDKVHEMLIAFVKGSYVRPHKHRDKSESFHLIQGNLSVIFFDDKGVETDRIALSASDSKKPFFFRSDREDWHTVLIESEYAVILETTSGPFVPTDKRSAPWSPIEDDVPAINNFLSRLSGS